MISSTGQTLIEQKRQQWAREREEMMGLCGLWGQAPMRLTESRRGSLLPPIHKHEDARAEESETSGYTSDSPLHDLITTKAQKQVQNEWRAQSTSETDNSGWGLQATPDSPEDRLKWGDRGVGVGHLWEPVPELPDARLPQVLESYRATPRWVERGLGLADGSRAEILEIHHQDAVNSTQSKYLLGQNVPLPPDVLEEREKKRIKAMQHQEAIRKQLDERDRKRKEEKENRLREERLEEERIMREREEERKRKEEEREKEKLKRNKEELNEQKMKEALKAAEQRSINEKNRQKRRELDRINEKTSTPTKSLTDSWCQSESSVDMQDASSQCDGGLALVLDGGPLALLMSPPRVLAHVATQTRLASTAHSSRSDISEKGVSGGGRSHSQPRRCLRERPKWGINRPTVQYLKQSEKDPHYLRRQRRRAKRTYNPIQDTPLPSELRLLPASTDDEGILIPPVVRINVLDNGFRMDSGQSSPRFVPIEVQDGASDKKGFTEETEDWLEEDAVIEAAVENDADVSDVDNLSPISQPDDDDVVVQANLIGRISALQVGLQQLNDSCTTDSTNSSLLSLQSNKEPAQVLDLSRVKISTQEEFKKYLEKVPEYKIKPEKVAAETVKIREKDWGVTPGRREAPHPHPYQYLDPTPPDMKSIQLGDLCPVTIDWKMLTTLRPKTKLEEDLFSRLVQLGKLDLKHQEHLKRVKDTDWVRRTKNPRSSIVETRVLSCPECTEDFCDGSVCGKLMYDNFLRPQASMATGVVKDGGQDGVDDGEQPVRRRRRRARARSRGVASRRLRKNSIFNRPPTRGCTRDHSKRERHAAAVVRSRSTSRDRDGVARTPRPVSPAPRSKSAPKIQFKGVLSSSSCPSHSATDTDNETENTSKRFVRKCTLNNADFTSGVWSDPYPYPPSRNTSYQYVSRDTTSCESDESDLSPGPPTAARILRPATVHLELGTVRNPPVSKPSLNSAPPADSEKPTGKCPSASFVTSRLSRVHLSVSATPPTLMEDAQRKKTPLRVVHSRPVRHRRPNCAPSACHVLGHKYLPSGQ